MDQITNEKATREFYTALQIDRDCTPAKLGLERITALVAPKSFPTEQYYEEQEGCEEEDAME